MASSINITNGSLTADYVTDGLIIPLPLNNQAEREVMINLDGPQAGTFTGTGFFDVSIINLSDANNPIYVFEEGNVETTTSITVDLTSAQPGQLVKIKATGSTSGITAQLKVQIRPGDANPNPSTGQFANPPTENEWENNGIYVANIQVKSTDVNVIPSSTTVLEGANTTLKIKLDTKPTTSAVPMLISDSSGKFTFLQDFFNFSSQDSSNDWNNGIDITATAAIRGDNVTDDYDVPITIKSGIEVTAQILAATDATRQTLEITAKGNELPDAFLTGLGSMVANQARDYDVIHSSLSEPLSIIQQLTPNAGEETLGIGRYRLFQGPNADITSSTFYIGDSAYVGENSITKIQTLKSVYAGLLSTGIVPTQINEGEEITIKVKLSNEPNENVTITPTHSSSEGFTFTPASFIFTSANWNIWKAFKITADENTNITAPEDVTITLTSTSANAAYNGLTIVKTVRVIDNDSAEILVGLPNPPQIVEGAAALTLPITLNNKPDENVTVTLSNPDSNLFTFTNNPITLTVDGANTMWNSGSSHTNPITIEATRDNIDYDNKLYTFTLTSNATTLIPALTKTFDLTYVDHADDNAEIEITNISTINNTSIDQGSNVNISIKLKTKPTSNVIVSASAEPAPNGNGDLTFFTFNQITFTPSGANIWSTAQNIQATAVTMNDKTLFNLSTNNAEFPNVIKLTTTTDDNKYKNPPISNVLTLNWRETTVGGISIDSKTPSIVPECTSSIIALKLSSQPTQIVTVTASDATGKFTFDKSVTFTPSNYNTSQNITATAVEDYIDTSNTDVTITFTTSSSVNNYNNITNTTTLTHQNIDTKGIIVTSNKQLINEGETVDINMKLKSKPTHNVTITTDYTYRVGGAASINYNTGNPSANPFIFPGAGSRTFSFTPSNYNTLQTITLTGDDNDRVIANAVAEFFFTSASTDANYNTTGTDLIEAYDENNNQYTNNNFDITLVSENTAGIIVTPVKSNVIEGGTAASLTVKLNSEPNINAGNGTSTVTLNITQTPGAKFTFKNASNQTITDLTLNASNWNTGVVITAHAVEDNEDTNNTEVTVTFTANNNVAEYDGITKDICLVHVNTDTAGITLDTAENTRVEGSNTTVSIKLDSKPTHNVTITPTMSPSDKFTITPANLTFEPNNNNTKLWSTYQAFTVTAVTDDVFTNNTHVTFTFTATSTDSKYNNLKETTEITHVDNEGGILTQDNGIMCTSFFGKNKTSGFFLAKLSLQPASDVVINVSSADSNTISINNNNTSLTFTNANWNTFQSVVFDAVAHFKQNIPSEIVKITLSVDDANSANSFDAAPDVVIDAKIQYHSNGRRFAFDNLTGTRDGSGLLNNGFNNNTFQKSNGSQIGGIGAKARRSR